MSWTVRGVPLEFRRTSIRERTDRQRDVYIAIAQRVLDLAKADIEHSRVGSHNYRSAAYFFESHHFELFADIAEIPGESLLEWYRKTIARREGRTET